MGIGHDFKKVSSDRLESLRNEPATPGWHANDLSATPQLLLDKSHITLLFILPGSLLQCSICFIPLAVDKVDSF